MERAPRASAKAPHASPLGTTEPAPPDPNEVVPVRPLRLSAWRRAGFVGLMVAMIGVLGAMAVGGIWVLSSPDRTLVGSVTVGESVTGVIGPETPLGAADKPTVDYSLEIERAGTYRIDVATTAPDRFDPVISLMEGTNVLDRDDDSGEGVDARLERPLRPGSYTVRITRYALEPMSDSVPFTISVDRVRPVAVNP